MQRSSRPKSFGLEGDRQSCHDANVGLGLDAIEVVDDREADGHKARPVVLGEAYAWSQIESIAARVWVRHTRLNLFGMPFAVEFEHKIPRGPLSGLLMMGVGMA